MGSCLGSCLGSLCAWACCTSVGSICNACLGNDKSSDVNPSSKSGRKRSIFLISISIIIAISFQYGLAPALKPDEGSIEKIPFAGEYIVKTWNDGCSDLENSEMQSNCRGNNGVFRVSMISFLFFLFAALAAYCKPTSNREAWFCKVFLYLVAVIASIFIPSVPLFSAIYLHLGRIGGTFFMIIQQLILLDISYNLNDALVRRANEADAIDPGSGKKWLIAILTMCATLYLGSIVVIGILFYLYSGCASNETFIWLTTIFSIAITVVQLTGGESNLLTSAVLTAYGTYLAFYAISRNPNGECNPFIREKDILGIILGMTITIVSLIWTAYSTTANERLLSTSEDQDGDSEPAKRTTRRVQGVVITTNEENYHQADDLSEPTGDSDDKASPTTWQMNMVCVLLVCWISMVLTGWGSIQVGGDEANPILYGASMWMIIISQWIMYALYLWTLVAPKIFPDRDFS